METSSEETVELRRSVRFGRVIIGGAVLGALIATLVTLSFPVMSVDYTMGQAVGFMALVGAALGLAAGAFLALILNWVAAKKSTTAVARRTDVG